MRNALIFSVIIRSMELTYQWPERKPPQRVSGGGRSGTPDYYPRFGFVPSRNYNIASEYDVPPEVFTIIELQLDALTGQSGIARYHEAFAEL